MLRVTVEKHAVQDPGLLFPGEPVGLLVRGVRVSVPGRFSETERPDIASGAVRDVAALPAGLTASESLVGSLR